MIKVENVSINYTSVPAIDNLLISLDDGNIYGLIGPNGSGKSSLIKALVGIISEYSGQIFYDDLLLAKNRHKIKIQLGYAPEDVELLPYLTGKEFLHMLADLRKINDKDSQIEKLVENLVLSEVENELINTYSHGMRQKLSLAAALIGKPKYIILDEALNGLDTIALLNVKNMLKDLSNKGHLILLSSHVLEIVENWCHRILILNKGKLMAQYSQKEIIELKEKDGKDFSEHFASLIKKKD